MKLSVNRLHTLRRYRNDQGEPVEQVLTGVQRAEPSKRPVNAEQDLRRSVHLGRTQALYRIRSYFATARKQVNPSWVSCVRPFIANPGCPSLSASNWPPRLDHLPCKWLGHIKVTYVGRTISNRIVRDEVSTLSRGSAGGQHLGDTTLRSFRTLGTHHRRKRRPSA
jgi:hypothetical protein